MARRKKPKKTDLKSKRGVMGATAQVDDFLRHMASDGVMGMEDMSPEDQQLFQQSPAAFMAKHMMQNDLSPFRHPESATVQEQMSKGNLGGIAVPDDGNKGPSITVEEFLYIRKVMGQDAMDAPEAEAMAQARCYYVPPMLYAAAYHEADVWSEQTIWNQEWVPFDYKNEEETLESIKQDGEPIDYMMKLAEAGKRMELPPTPFEVTYIGFGSGLTIPRMHIELRAMGMDEEAEYGKLLGILIDQKSSQVWEMIRLHMESGQVRLASYPTRTIEGEDGEVICNWRQNVCMNLTPWVVPCLIKAIETTAKPGSRVITDRAVRKLKKETGLVTRPPRFYTVKVAPHEAKDLAQQVVGSAFSRSLSYRFDVRGHWRLLVKRSTEQLYQKDRFKLEAKGYTVGTTFAELGPDLVQAISDRSLPALREGEWIAAKLVRVKDHQKGPEDAPYVPAIREA